MKKVIFTLFLLLFLFCFEKANASDSCIPNEHPTIENTRDFIYEVGQPHPDYLENVTSIDNCGNEVMDIIIGENKVIYDETGIYPLYYYSMKTAVSVNVYVYEDIPMIYGLKDFYHEVNSNPIDYLFEVTAEDVYNNGDITDLIEVDDSDIDYSTVGIYDLVYSVKDNLNNETVKTMKVYIQDTIKPTISNYKNLTLEVNTDLDLYDFWEGINVTDNSLNPVTKNLNLDNLIITEIGEYEILYNVKDESNNENVIPIMVKVVDTIKPEIKNVINLTFDINASLNRSLFTQNIIIKDNYDGNISLDKLIIDFRLVNTSLPGVYPVFYFVSDSSGNYTYKIISVSVVDEDIPNIINTTDIRVPLNTQTVNYLENIYCEDDTDGNLTNHIIVYDDLVNLNEIGVYPVMYIVYDSSGNYDIKKINVIVYDEEKPVIIGVEDFTIEVNLQYSKDYFLTNVTAIDNNDGDISENVDVDISQINFSELGTYQIKYFVTDSSNNLEEVFANVTVVDTTKPVISGFQDLTITINQQIDESFLLEGITVMDNYDGDITANANVSGFYDSSKEGTYPLTIQVSDSNGNSSEVIFNLIVIIEEEPINEENKNNYSMFYIIGGIGLSLVVTGLLGYRTRKMI